MFKTRVVSGLKNISIWITVLTVFVVSIHASHRGSSIPPFSIKTSSNIRALIPQGWNFFTRDPKEDKMFVFAVRGNQIFDLSLGSNATLPNLFGLRRANRVQNIEVANLLRTVSKAGKFISCEEDVLECYRGHEKVDSVIENFAADPTICGNVVFSRQRTVPWAFRKLTRKLFKNQAIAVVSVRCSKERYL